MVVGPHGELFALITTVLTDAAFVAVEEVCVYMTTHQCLAENQHRYGSKNPPAETGNFASGRSVHPRHCKIFPMAPQD